MPKHTILCDLDDAAQRRSVQAHVKGLHGKWKVEFQPWKEQRSSASNRYYWGVIVALLFEHLSQQDYEVTSAEEAHEILKAKFLTVDIADSRTGEVIARRVRSTTELDVAEFAAYVDACRHWLLDFFGIVTPDADSWGTRAIA